MSRLVVFYYSGLWFRSLKVFSFFAIVLLLRYTVCTSLFSQRRWNKYPCKNLTEISARSRDRAEKSSPRWDRGNLAEIARRDNHHLGEISKYRVEISTSRRDRNAISPHQTRSWRDNRDLGAISKYRAEISSEKWDCNTISPRQTSSRTSSRRDSHNLGADSHDLGDFMSRFLLLQRRDCLDLCQIYLIESWYR